MTQQICQDCGATSFKEDYNDGSLVCTSCGLVAQAYLLDDRPIFDASRDVNSHIYQETTRALPEYILCALSALDIDSADIEHTVAEIFNNTHNKNRRLTAAFAVYEAVQRHRIIRISKDQVCAAFDIYPRQFSQHQSRSISIANQTVPAINTRLMKQATLFIDDPRQRMKAVHAATAIETKLKLNQEYMAKKTSKMDLVILFYVCCNTLNLKMRKGAYITSTTISSTTFNRHLKLLNKLVESNAS